MIAMIAPDSRLSDVAMPFVPMIFEPMGFQKHLDIDANR